MKVPPAHAVRAVVAIAVLVSMAGAPAAATARIDTENGDIHGHDNRRAAGMVANGRATVRLFAARGVWRPEGETGPALGVAAFGEEGGPLTIPGPLLRVPEGTEIVLSVRNRLAERLEIHGLVTRPAPHDPVLSIQAGGTREVRFLAGAPGTYHYWATTTGAGLADRIAADSQLGGALIVDPKGNAEADRIFVMTQWDDSPARDRTNEGLSPDSRKVFAMNGFSWPHTERLDERVGRPVRWHIVNLTQTIHPMHLHGFYFTVQGTSPAGLSYAAYAPRDDLRVVTEAMLVGGTMQLTWTPERAGNWLLHCHVLSHVSPALRFWNQTDNRNGHDGHDMSTGMAGLVIGVRVTGDESAPAAIPASPRQMTLVMHRQRGYWRPEDAYGFALKTGERDPEPEHVRVPGPLLVLTRGEAVEITLKNELPEATAIHWHGIELDSYYDGVPGWSGTATNTTPPIHPRGSFIVRFTPPRAGTFIYHTHSHDNRQLASGLYGALVVLEPGETFDHARDHVIVLGMEGAKDTLIYDRLPIIVNGSRTSSLTLKAGVANRLRFINITTSFSGLMASLSVPSNPQPPTSAEWMPMAKDGASLPSSLQVVRPAQVILGLGQTYDFVVTPAVNGPARMWLDVRRISGEWVQQVPVRIAK